MPAALVAAEPLPESVLTAPKEQAAVKDIEREQRPIAVDERPALTAEDLAELTTPAPFFELAIIYLSIPIAALILTAAKILGILPEPLNHTPEFFFNWSLPLMSGALISSWALRLANILNRLEGSQSVNVSPSRFFWLTTPIGFDLAALIFILGFGVTCGWVLYSLLGALMVQALVVVTLGLFICHPVMHVLVNHKVLNELKDSAARVTGKQPDISEFADFHIMTNMLKLLFLVCCLTLIGPAGFFPIFIPIIIFLYPLFQVGLYSKLSGKINRHICELEKQVEAKNIRDLGFENDKPIELRYNTYSEIDNWWKRRSANRSVWKRAFIALLLLAAATIVWHNPPTIVQFLTAILTETARANYANEYLKPNAGPLPFWEYNSSSLTFIHMLCASIATAFALALVTYFRRARSLSINPLGLGFTFGLMEGQLQERVCWNEITAIELQNCKNKQGAAKKELVLRRGKREPLTIRLDCLQTAQDKETLLAAFDRYAPTVARHPGVTQALSAPIDNIYTELWLQALTAPPKRERLKPLLPGVLIGQNKFAVKRELGSGGQGFAYLAQHSDTGAELVLKEFVLPVYVGINERKRALDLFEKEARLLSRLDHPQIVKLTGFFVEDHRAYLALEHIDGESLRDLVSKSGPLSEQKVKELARQMAAILGYLHSRIPAVIHRDFTPDNLILHKDGTLKLIDFNVAQEIQIGTTGTVVGKRAYIAPEQFRGQATTKSDIYAMGATLYFLLTGQDPVAISTSSVRAGGRQICDDLEDLVAELTAIDQEQRPETERLLMAVEPTKPIS